MNEEARSSSRKERALVAHIRETEGEPATIAAVRFMMEEGQYMVLTDREADIAAQEVMRESLWAFNPDFLAEQTGLPESVFTALADGYESSNEAVLALIERLGSWEDFYEDAIHYDGRGHFMSGYDGEENEQDGYFIYRGW